MWRNSRRMLDARAPRRCPTASHASLSSFLDPGLNMPTQPSLRWLSVPLAVPSSYSGASVPIVLAGLASLWASSKPRFAADGASISTGAGAALGRRAGGRIRAMAGLGGACVSPPLQTAPARRRRMSAAAMPLPLPSVVGPPLPCLGDEGTRAGRDPPHRVRAQVSRRPYRRQKADLGRTVRVASQPASRSRSCLVGAVRVVVAVQRKRGLQIWGSRPELCTCAHPAIWKRLETGNGRVHRVSVQRTKDELRQRRRWSRALGRGSAGPQRGRCRLRPSPSSGTVKTSQS